MSSYFFAAICGLIASFVLIVIMKYSAYKWGILRRSFLVLIYAGLMLLFIKIGTYFPFWTNAVAKEIYFGTLLLPLFIFTVHLMLKPK